VPLYALGDKQPLIHPTAFVHPDAVLIGDVEVGEDSSIWPGAVLRGDEGFIRVGRRTSIQDNCVLHTTRLHPTTVGSDCVIGHLVHLEGCTIEDDVLVGNASIVMHRVIVRSGSMVAANAVVLDDTEVPTGALAVGVPATIKAGRAHPGRARDGAQIYVRRAEHYRQHLRRIG